MKARKLLALLLAAGMLLTGALPERRSAKAAETIVYAGVTGLPFENGDPFKGVDVSSIIAIEQSGVKFYDRAGREQDIFVTMAQAGVNSVRIRIWNDPKTASGQTYGGGANDVQQAVKIAQRCAKAGLSLLVDFHYSDFWADPQKQSAPKAWKSLNVSQKASAIYDFTTDTLQQLKQTGAQITMVQVGNETTTGMCGVFLADGNWSDDIWRQLASLWNAGAKAVRDFDRNTLVALHFTNPEKASNMAYIAKMLAQTKVDYDVFATSYYPYWHGTLTNLTNVLSDVARSYGKQVMVAETSWAYTFDNMDGGSNTISDRDSLGDYVNYPVSVEGQTAFLQDLFRAVAAVPDGKGIGVFYWEPAWLGVSSNYDTALALWNRYGGGWACECAKEYDADAKWYGGSAVDNQALFDAAGKPLDSLYVFGNVRGTGGQRPPQNDRNLLKNGGFEADGGWTDRPAGWELRSTAPDGHFDVRAEDARSGGYALHWYTESGFTGSTARTEITAPEDGLYTVSCSIQADESSTFLLSAGTDRADQASESGSGSGWSVWTQPGVVVAARKGDRIAVEITVSTGAGGYGSVDDCEIVRVGALPAETTRTVTTTTTTETTTTTTETTASAPPPMRHWGDVNLDGEVNVADAVLLARLAASDKTAVVSAEGERNGDVTHDGSTDSKDLTKLLQYLGKKITEDALAERR